MCIPLTLHVTQIFERLVLGSQMHHVTLPHTGVESNIGLLCAVYILEQFFIPS
jgi:hypothetical protein